VRTLPKTFQSCLCTRVIADYFFHSFFFFSPFGSIVTGMACVPELRDELQLANIVCKNGRRHLDNARLAMTKGGFTIVSRTRKKKHLLVRGLLPRDFAEFFDWSKKTRLFLVSIPCLPCSHLSLFPRLGFHSARQTMCTVVANIKLVVEREQAAERAIREGDFPKAIASCKECLDIIGKMDQVAAVRNKAFKYAVRFSLFCPFPPPPPFLPAFDELGRI
jgi:hypothetical protein